MKKTAAVALAALLGLWSCASAAIFSGTVTDSADGKAIRWAYVNCGAVTVVTDSLGNFTLNTTAGVAPSPRVRENPKVTWYPQQATFSWQGYQGEVTIRVTNIRGSTVAHYASGKNGAGSHYTLPRLAQGMYVAAISAGGVTASYTILKLTTRSAAQFQSMPLMQSASTASLTESDTVIFTKAYYRGVGKIFPGSQSGVQVPMARDSTRVGVSAGVTDSSGRVTLKLAGKPVVFHFANVYGMPAQGIRVGVRLNPNLPGMGVLLATFPKDARPPIVAVLRGTQGLLTKRISSPKADSIDMAGIGVKIGSFANSVLEILNVKVIPYVPGAKTFLAGIDIAGQLGDMAKVMNALPGQPVSAALTEMGIGQATTITAADALKEILNDNIVNSVTSIVLGGAATIAENPTALKGVKVGMGLSMAGTVFDATTVLSCQGSISRLKTGPYVFYSCAQRPNPWEDLTNNTLVRVAVAGSADGEGSVELISKDRAGFGIVAPLNTGGTADVPVPLGRYDMQVQGPSFIPVMVKGVNITAGGGPIYVATTPIPIDQSGPFDGNWSGKRLGQFTRPDSTWTYNGGTLFISIGDNVIMPGHGTVDASGNGTWADSSGTAGYNWCYTYKGTFLSSGSASGTWTFSEPWSNTTGVGTWTATRN
jgi:hypothetical protein